MMIMNMIVVVIIVLLGKDLEFIMTTAGLQDALHGMTHTVQYNVQ